MDIVKLTPADPHYPEHGDGETLWAAGNKQLLARKGLAVVGSRKASQIKQNVARMVGADCAGRGIPVISGGARGIDQAAMLGGLMCGGEAVGFLPGDLDRKMKTETWSPYLESGRLALAVFGSSPGVRFSAARALRRNRNIYRGAVAALVVASDFGFGGTWQGAQDNLAGEWSVPLWAVPGTLGTDALIESGQAVEYRGELKEIFPSP